MLSCFNISYACNASNTVIPAATMVTLSSGDSRRIFDPPILNVCVSSYITGVFERSVRKYPIPGCVTSVDKSFSVETASQGCNTTVSGSVANIAMSSNPICDDPSSPIETPACDPTNFIFASDNRAMRTWSKAQVRNAANVETNGSLPNLDNPNATPTDRKSVV